MTAQSFDSVFQKISLSEDTQQAFRGTIVEKLNVHKKNRVFHVGIAAQRMIPLQKWDNLKAELLRQIPGVREVKIDVAYDMQIESAETLAETYWETIRTFIAQQSKVCAGVISDAEWKMRDEKMQILVKNNMAYYLSQKG